MLKKSINKIMNYFVIVALFSIIFVVLIENFNIVTILIGVIIAVLSIIFTNRFLLDDCYHSLFDFNIIGFLVYFFILFYNIIISGIHAAYLTIYGKVKLNEINYKSNLKSTFGLTLLANSITMTPGTVTVSMKNNELLILQLCKSEEISDIKDIKKLEKYIAKFVVK